MIRFMKPLYLSEAVKGKEKKIMRAIKHRKRQKKAAVIALAANPDNLFDLYNAKELLWPYYKKQDIDVIGLAEDMEDARELLCRMIEEAVQNTGPDYIREYFAGRMSEPSFRMRRTVRDGQQKGQSQHSL